RSRAERASAHPVLHLLPGLMSGGGGQPFRGLAALPTSLLARRLLLLLLHQPLLVRRRDLWAGGGHGDLVVLFRERDRPPAGVVLDRRAGVGADVEVLVPLEDERDRVLHLLTRDVLTVDLQHAGTALAEPAVAAEHERRRSEPVVLEVELQRVLARS